MSRIAESHSSYGCGQSSLSAQQSRFVERTLQKIFLNQQLPNFCMQLLDLMIRCPGTLFLAEHPRHILNRLLTPLADLIGMHSKLLRQLGNGLFAVQCRQRHLGLELRREFPSGSSHQRTSAVSSHPHGTNGISTYRPVQLLYRPGLNSRRTPSPICKAGGIFQHDLSNRRACSNTESKLIPSMHVRVPRGHLPVCVLHTAQSTSLLTINPLGPHGRHN